MTIDEAYGYATKAACAAEGASDEIPHTATSGVTPG
jgi:hypothetical protein